jgi:hypothetical protein
MSEGAVRSVAGNLTAAGCRLGTRMTLARTKILKGAFVMADQSHPQNQPPTPPTTGVFALLKAKPGVTRERVMAIMPAEVRATVQLYLEGKIREWYSREDGRGGVFFLNTRDVAEAKSIMESLPLAKEDMLDHEYIPVGPLMPLRLLMANQSAKQ